LDIESRAIRRCDVLFGFDGSRYRPDDALADGNPKLPDLRTLGAAPSEPLPYRVRLTDLDRNGHMNNARYGDAVYNACTKSELDTRSIARFDINFLSELFEGDEFFIRRADADGAAHFEATGTNGRAVFRARILWA
jgi:acyl-ACP thioesterase